MSVFSSNFTLAVILEVGEDDVLLSVDNEEIELKLTDKNRETVLISAQEGDFIIPFDRENNEILADIDEEDEKELFSEYELEELQNATDDIPEEHK